MNKLYAALLLISSSLAAQTINGITGQSVSGVTSSPAYVAGGGSANAQTATYSPAIGSLTAGLHACWLPTAANTTTTPTFSPNGLTAKTITKLGATPVAAGDLTTTAVACAIYDGSTNWQLQNPQTATSGGGFQPTPLPVPTLASFTQTNFVAAGASDATIQGLPVLKVAANATLQRALETQTNAFSTPYSIAASWSSNQASSGTGEADSELCLTDGTKYLCAVMLFSAGTQQWRILGCTTISSGCTNQAGPTTLTIGQMPTSPWNGRTFWRWRNNGTTLSADTSVDGVTWVPLFTQSVGTFLTPTGYGWGGFSITAGVAYNIALQGWLATNSATL